LNCWWFELLVVVAIIAVLAVLAGLLLPGLNAAKASVRGTVCRNNLHQIGLASMMYADDNRGKLFPYPKTERCLYARP
jgi:type II secretory pathway pseudopilin PulG